MLVEEGAGAPSAACCFGLLWAGCAKGCRTETGPGGQAHDAEPKLSLCCRHWLWDSHSVWTLLQLSASCASPGPWGDFFWFRAYEWLSFALLWSFPGIMPAHSSCTTQPPSNDGDKVMGHGCHPDSCKGTIRLRFPEPPGASQGGWRTCCSSFALPIAIQKLSQRSVYGLKLKSPA